MDKTTSWGGEFLRNAFMQAVIDRPAQRKGAQKFVVDDFGVKKNGRKNAG
jgi:hypothetical protein